MEQKIKAGIQQYLSPILILLVGYLLQDKITAIDKRIERIELAHQVIIEVRVKVADMERRIGIIEDRQPLWGKHEKEITERDITK